MVLVTTLDDAVWLVPFVVRQRSRVVAALHATVFCATLVGMAATVSIATVLLEQHSLAAVALRDDTVWTTALGVTLCWSLATFLWYRSMRKRQRQREHLLAQQRDDSFSAVSMISDHPDNNIQTEVDPLLLVVDTTTATTKNGGDGRDNDRRDHHNHDAIFRPWMVISLTFLGSLDEISYFPSLLLGGIFTPAELCLGTLVAALTMVVVVVVFLRPCQPLMEALDKIPLYAIVSLFATLLTVELVWDLCTSSDED